MKRIVENMGLAWNSQYSKLMNQKAKFSCYDIITTAPDDKSRAMLCMPFEKLPLWLATINPNKIPGLAIREKVERYQAESAIVLYEYWTKGGSAATDRRVDGLEAAVAGLQAAFGKMADAVAGLADGMSKLADAVRTLQAEPRGIGPDALKDAVRGELAKRTTALRFGKTAGQILRDGGFPGVKGLAGWAGHRLRAVGCQIDGDGMGEFRFREGALSEAIPL